MEVSLKVQSNLTCNMIELVMLRHFYSFRWKHCWRQSLQMKQLEIIYIITYWLNTTSSESGLQLKYLLFRIIHPLRSLEKVIYLRVKNRSAFCIRSGFLLRICEEALHLQFYVRPPVLSQNDNNHRLHRLHHVWNFLVLV